MIGRNTKYTTEEYVNKANISHENKYTYDRLEYKGMLKAVTITCSIHGDFAQIAQSHLKGQGCPKCSKTSKDTLSSFIDKARRVHGDEYDYSHVEYINSVTKILIVCKKHGMFEKYPYLHLQGQGCTKCKKRGWTTEEFTKEANYIHSNKYDYSKIKFTTLSEAVTITCKVHGDFTQEPKRHITGLGCFICKNANNFVERATKLHSGIYSYENLVYWDSNTKVVITCPVHGNFEQTPKDHLAKCGCPRCGEIKQRKKYHKEPTLLYYIYLPDFDLYKVGITLIKNGLRKRFAKKYLNYEVVATVEYPTGLPAYTREQQLLEQFKEKAYIGIKVLNHGGDSELFKEDILKELSYDGTRDTETNNNLLREGV